MTLERAGEVGHQDSPTVKVRLQDVAVLKLQKEAFKKQVKEMAKDLRKQLQTRRRILKRAGNLDPEDLTWLQEQIRLKACRQNQRVDRRDWCQWLRHRCNVDRFRSVGLASLVGHEGGGDRLLASPPFQCPPYHAVSECSMGTTFYRVWILAPWARRLRSIHQPCETLRSCPGSGAKAITHRLQVRQMPLQYDLEDARQAINHHRGGLFWCLPSQKLT